VFIISNEDIDVNKAILSVCKKLKENPFIIYSEADLQVLLTSELLKQDPELYETNRNYKSKKIKTSRIHREFPYYKGRTDVVVFSKDDIENINFYLHVKLNQSIHKKRAVFCSNLIELKYSHGELKKKEVLLKDFNKLREASNLYESQFNFKSNLFFVYYVFFNFTNRTNLKKHIETLKELLISSLKTHINYYLIIGPEEKWYKILSDDENLKEYLSDSSSCNITFI